ncbi:hypothetical protein GCM10022251_56870 [Phytohabitans flavus]|uniref:Uncharacterized protein n=1 Tax=Phytohabitans flavus TaxID=1076124 RepID=A0A6F8XU10_9ACTN|nr:hypothetical protein [Phytohabitans flavus]BCB77228.1 hypothetical protein Pflav_036380 [Phytohabitans flavus]
MDWYRDRDPGMYGRYDDTGDARCPICYVPPGAPHMNSCDDTGTWRGDTPGEATRADEWEN